MEGTQVRNNQSDGMPGSGVIVKRWFARHLCPESTADSPLVTTICMSKQIALSSPVLRNCYFSI